MEGEEEEGGGSFTLKNTGKPYHPRADRNGPPLRWEPPAGRVKELPPPLLPSSLGPWAGRGDLSGWSRRQSGAGRGRAAGMAAPARRWGCSCEERWQHADGRWGRSAGGRATCSSEGRRAGGLWQSRAATSPPTTFPQRGYGFLVRLLLSRRRWASSAWSLWWPRWTTSTTTARSWRRTWRRCTPPTRPSPTCTASAARWKVGAAGKRRLVFLYGGWSSAPLPRRGRGGPVLTVGAGCSLLRSLLSFFRLLLERE